MKLLFTIFFLLITLSLAVAGESGNSSNDPLVIEKSSNERDGASGSGVNSESVESEELAEEESLIQESDSSEYSVNKFNYLFYLIYKIKYLDVQQELNNSKAEPVQVLD